VAQEEEAQGEAEETVVVHHSSQMYGAGMTLATQEVSLLHNANLTVLRQNTTRQHGGMLPRQHVSRQHDGIWIV
jgi:hypothetical protein